MNLKIKGDRMKLYLKYVLSVLGVGLIFLTFQNAASVSTINTIENVNRKQCLAKPVSACTPNKPCFTDTDKIILSSNVPDCAQDNPANTFKNADKMNRHFCFYNGSAKDSKPRPLVIYLHGGSGNASNVYGSSNLRAKAETFPLSPSVNGFHMLSLQARNLNGNEIDLSPSTHHDAFWWDFRAPSTNPDMRDLDDIIGSIVSKYAVDKSRIYLVGWSEGGMLSQLYGISRHQTPSVYGLKIAATTIYSAPSPFFWRYSPNQDYCSTNLDFTTQFPIQIISRSCDIPCNQEQQDFFGKDSISNHATPISLWKDILINTLKNKNAEFSLIDDDGNPTNSCMPVGNGPKQCNQEHGFLNHLTWPKKSETKMLNFLKNFQSVSVAIPPLTFNPPSATVTQGPGNQLFEVKGAQGACLFTIYDPNGLILYQAASPDSPTKIWPNNFLPVGEYKIHAKDEKGAVGTATFNILPPKPEWVNANPGETEIQTCARKNLKPAQDVGYGICASGENRPTSGLNAAAILYPYGTWGNSTTGGVQIVPYSISTSIKSRDDDRVTTTKSGIDCYAKGAKQDHDGSDLAVAYLCVAK